MNARVYIVLLVLIFLAGPLSAQPIGIVNACDFCIASQGISPLEMGRTGLRYDVRYLKLSKEYSDGKLVANSSNESEEFFTNQFTLSYQLASDISLIEIVPVATKTARMSETDMNSSETITNTGFGDVLLIGRYNLFADHSLTTTKIVAMSAGLKLPTGGTHFRDAAGEIADPDMQLGTGSLDAVVAANVLYGTHDLAVAFNTTATFTSKGANGHQYGNNVNYDATARYRVYCKMDDCAPSLFATAGIIGEWRAHELQDGVIDPNSGGNVIYVAPGVQAFLSQSISFEARFQLPIVHALNGDQLGETYKIASGLQYLF